MDKNIKAPPILDIQLAVVGGSGKQKPPPPQQIRRFKIGRKNCISISGVALSPLRSVLEITLSSLRSVSEITLSPLRLIDYFLFFFY